MLGQESMALHLRSHWSMFTKALRSCDAPEVAGQLFRLTLVPFGHITGRLPRGNIGRSTVSAFQSMPVSEEIAALIHRTLAKVQQRAGPE